MRISLVFVITVVISLMFIGNTLYESGDVENIYNLTEESFEWNYTYSDIVIENVSDMTSVNVAQAGRLGNVVNKFIDFIGYTLMEVSKFFVEYGYNNPQYDYEHGFTLMKYYLIILLVGFVLPLVIPLIAMITIIVMLIKSLISRLSQSGKTTPKEAVE